jgi:hypothetical protein
MEDEKHIIHDHSLGFAEIYSAIVSAQAELTNPVKDTKGYGYKYAGLDQIVAILRNVLPKHGLWFEQNLQPAKDGHIGIETFIVHKSGQRTQPSFYEHPLEDAKGMNASQANGSCISYAKKYALGCVFALPAEEDTDGVVKKPAPKPKAKPAPTKSLVERCQDKLVELKIEDWANGISYIPRDAKDDRNEKFLKTKPSTLMNQAEQWRAENG